MMSVYTPPSPASVRVQRDRHSGAVAWAVLVVLVAALGVVACWRLFVDTASGQAVDQAALEGAHIGQSTLWRLAKPVLNVVSASFILTAVVVCGLVALVRRRWSLAIAAVMVIGGSNATTQILKRIVWDRPDWGHGSNNTLPSGHTTGAASVAVAVLLVVPPRVRPWVAVLGAGYAGATGVSTLVGQWHRPSDVAAALLVVLAWGALACVLPPVGRDSRTTPTAAVPVISGRPMARTGERVAVLLLLLVALAAGVTGALGLISTWNSADPLADRASQLTAYGGGALGITAVAAFCFAVLTVLRRSTAASGLRDGPS